MESEKVCNLHIRKFIFFEFFLNVEKLTCISLSIIRVDTLNLSFFLPKQGEGEEKKMLKLVVSNMCFFRSNVGAGLLM